MRISRLCFALAFGLAVTSMPHAAAAQHSTDQLTEENIAAFIEESTRMTSRGLDAAPEDIAAFFETHLHPQARFKSNITFHIPEQPSQEKAVTLTRAEFIDSLESGSQSLGEYETSIDVESVQISSDGRKATAKTRGSETGIMTIEGQPVPVEGESECTQIIMLSDEDIIQMYNANCKTSINFRNY